MDILESYVKDNTLNREAIREYVDDYSLFSYYIGTELELRTKYSSPLRLGDNDPSFSLFYYKEVLLFKDNATGVAGDIIKFLMLFLRVSFKTVLSQINSDFGLNLTDEDVGEFKPALLKKAPIKKYSSEIKLTWNEEYSSKFLEYWKLLDISVPTLQKYLTTDVNTIHYITKEDHKTVYPRELTIGYEILGTYKTYQPYAKKEFKFRNNFKPEYVEGAIQLEFKQDFVLITKSTKECIFFYEHFKVESVAGKSENTMIPKHFMENILFKKYKRVYIWLDSDEAGINAQNKYLELYPNLIPITFTESKDPTDFYRDMKKVGKQQQALKQIQKQWQY